MASFLVTNGNQKNIITQEYMCDTVADLDEIDKEQANIGSTAFIINNATLYMLNSQKEWIQI